MRRFLLFAMFAMMNTIVLGQGEISGQILAGDLEREGLPGASVYVKGTGVGTVTDFNGFFSLKASIGDKLTISFIGYKTKEFKVNSDKVVFTLMPDLESLEEVVVVGYGTKRKSDITGSVASIRLKDLNPGPVISVSGYLQNTAPGVVLTQSSAQPGGGFDIKIRGATSVLGNSGPLYVVDGLPITSDQVEAGSSSRYRSSPRKNPLNGINPEDIIGIEILKDASATAIYGARGANGVVLITTKRGKKGKMKVAYSGSFSVQETSNQYDMLSGSEFAKVSNEEQARQNPTADPLYSPAEVNSAGEGTDWLSEILRLGTINRHQVSLSAGSAKYDYYTSLNYFKQNGVVKQSSLERLSGRVNFNYTFSDKIKVGTNFIISHIIDNQIPFGSTSGGGPEFAGLFDNTRVWSPIVKIRQQDGSFTRHPVVDNIPNPISLFDIDDVIRTNRFLGTAYMEYSITKKLKAKLNLGIDRSSSEREGLIPTTVIRGEQANGEADFSNNKGINKLGEFTLNYTKKIGNNDLNILAGYTYQQFDSESNSLLLTNFADQTEQIDNIRSADTVADQYFKERSRLLSYLSRVNYGIKNRYLFTFSIRTDGSTKFGPEQKWGVFPSAAFGWKIHEEPFFKEGTVEELKFRASYGQIGNQEIGNKRSQSVIATTRRAAIGGNIIRGLAAVRPENQNLKWETTTQLNLGLDMSMFKGRIQTSLDVYRKVTTDVLLNFFLPATAGFDEIVYNAGSILNRGIEFSITSQNLTGKLHWQTSFNIAYNANNWKDRAGVYEIGPRVEGQKDVFQGIYGYVVEGIFRDDTEITNSNQPLASPGMFKFKDANNDGEITAEDRVLLGKEAPDFSLGLNNILSYKKLQLNIFFQGMLGREKYNFTRASLENVNDILRATNKSVAVLDRYTADNPNGSVHSGALQADGGDNSLNSNYVEDASFIRLRNVTLGYNMKPKRGIESIRLYADVQNLLTITTYKGLDPETNEDLQYPSAKTYTIGLNVNF